ncbi:MAG: hypothetical protein KDB90_01780 [Planctomycetes bacterium]|nr:hypothetical protein [Planctomycetota bacterium]
MKLVTTTKVLKLEYSGEDWKGDAKGFAAKLTELEGVKEAVAGKTGVFTLKLTADTELEEATLKRLANAAGMKFVSLADPAPEPAD